MKKRGSGAVIHVEGPTEYVVRTPGGRKIKSCRSMSSAMSFSEKYLEKTNSRRLTIKGKLKYVPPTKVRTPARKPKRRKVAKKKARRR